MGGGIGISVGYSFEPKGLSVAPKTLANFLERKTQLYTTSGMSINDKNQIKRS